MTTLAVPTTFASAATTKSAAWRFDTWVALAMLFAPAVLRSIPKYYIMPDADVSVVAQVCFGALYVIAAMRLIGAGARARSAMRGSTVLWLFLGLTLLSSLWSTDAFGTFKVAGELVGTTIEAWYLVTFFTFEEFIRIVCIAFGIIAFVSLALVFGSPARGRTDWGAGPYSGLFYEKNGLGAAMALALLTIGVAIPGARGWSKVALSVTFLTCAFLLVGSNSITGAAVCALAGVVAGAAWAVLTRRVAMLAAVAGLAGLAALGYTLLFAGEPGSLFDAVGRSANLTGRTEFWPQMLAAVADRPFFGFGYAGFFFDGGPEIEYLGDFISLYYWIPPHAHNSFLQIALDTGLVGLGLFLVVLSTCATRAWRFARSGRLALSFWPLAIVAYLTIGSYDETYFAQENTLEWIFFVASLLYSRGQVIPASRMEPVAFGGDL